MVYNGHRCKMKKSYMVLFLLGLMACPFIFSSCEEDHGETDYNNVTDDDWKKKTKLFLSI